MLSHINVYVCVCVLVGAGPAAAVQVLTGADLQGVIQEVSLCLSGRLTWGLDQLFVDSQECRLGLLTALVQSNHLQGRRRQSEHQPTASFSAQRIYISGVRVISHKAENA